MNGPLSERFASSILALAVALFLLPACQKEDDAPSVSPTIVFNSDSGYAFQSDTVGMEDTLYVGVTMTSGDSPMHTVKVLAAFDGAAALTVDSFAVNTDTFVFQKTILTRAAPGTEEWTFWLQRHNGDIYRRSLTFTVE